MVTPDSMRDLISGLVNTERNTFSNINSNQKEESKEKEDVDFKKLYEDLISKVKDFQSIIIPK
jgi:hypothetical protein